MDTYNPKHDSINSLSAKYTILQKTTDSKCKDRGIRKLSEANLSEPHTDNDRRWSKEPNGSHSMES